MSGGQHCSETLRTAQPGSFAVSAIIREPVPWGQNQIFAVVSGIMDSGIVCDFFVVS